jgi:hypothetical protein
MLGSGPVGVPGAFDMPLGHLAFDDAGGGAEPSGWVEPAEQSAQEVLPQVLAVGVLVRGKKRPDGRGTGG